jgi:hypothetical protein
MAARAAWDPHAMNTAAELVRQTRLYGLSNGYPMFQ